MPRPVTRASDRVAIFRDTPVPGMDLRTASGPPVAPRYVLLPHWDPERCVRIMQDHAAQMGHRLAAPQVNQSLLDAAHNDGGFTLHDHVGDAPTTGYMVSLDKDSEYALPLAQLTARRIKKFVKKHLKTLSHPLAYLGGWLDGPNFYLDVSHHRDSLYDAARDAHANKQLAIYDLKNKKSMTTEEAGWATGLPGIVGRRVGKSMKEELQLGNPGAPLGTPVEGVPDPVNDPRGKLVPTGASFDDTADNLVGHYDGSTASQKKQGRLWYRVARNVFRGLAKQAKVDLPRAVAVGAALSPNTLWDDNIKHAGAMLMHYRPNDPGHNENDWMMAHIHPDALAQFRAQNGDRSPTHSDEDLNALADLHAGLWKPSQTDIRKGLPGKNDVAANPDLRRAWIENIKHHKIDTVLDDHERQKFANRANVDGDGNLVGYRPTFAMRDIMRRDLGVNDPDASKGTLGSNIRNAKKIIRAPKKSSMADFIKLLGTPKISNFSSNIIDPTRIDRSGYLEHPNGDWTQHDDLGGTIDAHHLRAALMRHGDWQREPYRNKKSKINPSDAPTYDVFNRSLLEATRRINAREADPRKHLTPKQVQAIIWLKHKADNDRFKAMPINRESEITPKILREHKLKLKKKQMDDERKRQRAVASLDPKDLAGMPPLWRKMFLTRRMPEWTDLLKAWVDHYAPDEHTHHQKANDFRQAAGRRQAGVLTYGANQFPPVNPPAADRVDVTDSEMSPSTRRFVRRYYPHLLAPSGPPRPSHTAAQPLTVPWEERYRTRAQEIRDAIREHERKMETPREVQALRRIAAPPNLSDLTDLGKTLGSHRSKVYADPHGNQWLLKYPNAGNTFLVPLDVATANLQRQTGLEAPETHPVPTDEGMATAVKMYPDAREVWGTPPRLSELSPQDQLTVQKHHALDWLIANHDAHVGNWLGTPQGLVGIDKGQALKYFGQDRLDPQFHPNYYAREPIYNRLWRHHTRGKGQGMLDPRQGELGDYVRTLQSVPDDHFREMFRPYAEGAAKAGMLGTGQYGKPNFSGVWNADPSRGLQAPDFPTNSPEPFLDALVNRKNTLSRDLGDFYDKATLKRQQSLSTGGPQ